MTSSSKQRLSCENLYDHLSLGGVEYFCGVPDSLVSSFSFYLEANAKESHIIAANEGNAIGIAIGYHVATNKIPLVYMQNSGLSNSIDPLASLADPTVLGVPMILLISWRGQPGKNDEPQHTKQGAITTELLESLNIPYQILSKDSNIAKQQVGRATEETLQTNRPSALIIEKDTFSDYQIKTDGSEMYPLSREQAIDIVLNSLNTPDVVVASIGKISREVFEFRDRSKQQHNKDLLIVGGMGHASSIALGIAKQKPRRKIFCLDGDGSVLMHMGSLSTIGTQDATNFYHIVFNNGMHDSVGGQRTAAFEVSLPAIAKNCGYSKSLTVDNAESLEHALTEVKEIQGPVMIEVLVHGGARDDLIRPSIHPGENKTAFMKYVRE